MVVVLALEPDNFAAHLNIGSALRRQKQYVASAAATRMALALNPKSSSAWGNLGNELKDLGEYAEAIECHTRAVELCAKSDTTSGKGAKATANPAAEIGACNTALIKPNQAGTVTETKAALDAGQRAGWGTIVSARSGETEDVTIAHLAVGWNAGQLKVGSFSRSERMAKWNEVLRIEEALGPSAPYAGRDVLPAP